MFLKLLPTIFLALRATIFIGLVFILERLLVLFSAAPEMFVKTLGAVLFGCVMWRVLHRGDDQTLRRRQLVSGIVLDLRLFIVASVGFFAYTQLTVWLAPVETYATAYAPFEVQEYQHRWLLVLPKSGTSKIKLPIVYHEIRQSASSCFLDQPISLALLDARLSSSQNSHSTALKTGAYWNCRPAFWNTGDFSLLWENTASRFEELKRRHTLEEALRTSPQPILSPEFADFDKIRIPYRLLENLEDVTETATGLEKL